MGLYDSNDLYWSWDGDLAIGVDGDVKDTSDDYLASLVQEIGTVVKSELGDWEVDPVLGCTLSDFVGEPNTRENGKAIEGRIRTKLVEANIVAREDLDVKVTPVGVHQLLIIISVTVAVTAQNKLTSQTVSTSLLYDTMENNLFFMPPVTAK